MIQQGFKGAPSSTRRKVQEIKATLSIKKNQITQWCQEGKTAIWIHKQLIQQGFKGAPSSTRRKVQEIKATLSIKNLLNI